jgi:type II secretory pathway pseudopilin PulG
MRTMKPKLGFSLLEVVLAVMLVSVGLLAILKVFPIAVHEAELTVVDTHEAMFAEAVLGGIEGNAHDIIKWAEWDVDDDDFTQAVLKDTILDGKPLADTTPGQGVAFPDPDLIPGTPDPDSLRSMRYSLEIKSDGDARRTVILHACAKRYANFSVHSHQYVTEVIFMGM